MDEKLKRQEELTNLLNKYSYNYYVLEKPIVSDYDYDVLYDELVSLEQENNFVFPASPTIRVGDQVLSGFKKVEHVAKLYSLNKCNNVEGLTKFIDDVNQVKKGQKFVVEYKFDGLRIIAHYSGGLLVQASTRGNGIVGEDVTAQVKTIKSVPLKIDYTGDLYVAGEGIITIENLEKYNKTAEEKLKNARNAVAGAIRNLDPKVTASRNLDVVFYDIVKIDNENLLSTQEEVFNFLKLNHFLTGKLFKVVTSTQEIEEIIDKIDKVKSRLNILIDGLVIKLNNLKLREEIGFTAKFPKWAIAYKFAPQELTATLKKVEWGVGRTGKITPTAIITPVELSGATVTRATLNNYEDILKKKIKLNSLVFVRRSNEVIPEILGLAQEGENALDIEKPKVCPCCKTPVQEVGPNIFCLNANCPEKVVGKLSYFASRNCMNIEGLSDKIIGVLYKNNKLKTFSDFYTLSPSDFEGLEGFKDKKITNILSSISKSKKCRLSNFLDSLSIDGVGEKTSKDLAKKFKNIENIKNASVESLTKVNDIGEIIASNIYNFFRSEVVIKEIEKLFSLGVKIEEEKALEVDENNPFFNKKIVLTGALENFTRTDATKLIENMGGEVASSVSKNTNFVVVGADAGSKLDKARLLNIPTLTEEEFLKILNEFKND